MSKFRRLPPVTPTALFHRQIRVYLKLAKTLGPAATTDLSFEILRDSLVVWALAIAAPFSRGDIEDIAQTFFIQVLTDVADLRAKGVTVEKIEDSPRDLVHELVRVSRPVPPLPMGKILQFPGQAA
jgi:hypothetical protein